MVFQCLYQHGSVDLFSSICISNNKIRLRSKPLGYSLWSPVCDESFNSFN